MLSALAVENAKPRAKQYLLTDGNGLHLMVTPQGSKLWRLRYRFGGKQNLMSLGAFPAVSLADARGKAHAEPIGAANRGGQNQPHFARSL